MADESASRDSLAEQLRVFAGRQALDEERELIYLAAETIENLAKAYIAEREALIAIRSERGPSRAEHDIEQAFQVLEAYGVPRERARSIQNGIGVLATRIEREERFQKAMEADAARYRWLRGGVHLNRFALDRQIESEAEMDAAIDAEIAKSNERPEPGGKP